jgi:hypothetical protein
LSGSFLREAFCSLLKAMILVQLKCPMCYSTPMMRRNIIVVMVCGSCISCSPIMHMEEAMRLSTYSQDLATRDIMIAQSQAKFKSLVESIASGDQLADIHSRGDLLARLGEPVVVKPEADGAERWLYRDPVRYFDVPKVYFFINQFGHVTHWSSSGIVIAPNAERH